MHGQPGACLLYCCPHLNTSRPPALPAALCRERHAVVGARRARDDMPETVPALVTCDCLREHGFEASCCFVPAWQARQMQQAGRAEGWTAPAEQRQLAQQSTVACTMKAGLLLSCCACHCAALLMLRMLCLLCCAGRLEWRRAHAHQGGCICPV